MRRSDTSWVESAVCLNGYFDRPLHGSRVQLKTRSSLTGPHVVMRGRRCLLFLIWILCLQLGSCSFAEILWGQCYAFCLTQESRQKKENVDSQPSLSERAVTSCLKHKQCKWCLFACERPREDYDDNDDCLSDCKKSRARHNETSLQACNRACEFITHVLQSKYGTCPQPSDMHGFSSACVGECDRDVECDGMKKCCENGCGSICHRPVESNEYPSVPNNLSFKERNDGGMLVEWESHRRNASLPVIYVYRWWCSVVQNVHYSVTTVTRVKLKGYPNGVPPAARCSFMVAAVTVRGSEGFSPVQTFIKKFLNPSPPVNLETSGSKMYDGKVDVTVQWQPPLFTDGLQITRYLIFWSDNLPKASANYFRLNMQKKALNGDRRSYTITSLEPSSHYFVQVRAEVKWKDKTIRGKPVSTYIETLSVPQAASQDTANIHADGTHEDSPVYNITVQDPVFVSSQLRANVTWSIHLGVQVEKYILYWNVNVCDKEASHRKTKDRLKHEATVHKREFQLYNLQFGCVYELRIHTATSGNMDKGVRTYFRTLPCWETEGQGLDSFCPPKVTPPPSPSDMSVHYKSTRGCMCQAVIRWQRQSEKGHKINQYSVLWGQSRPPPGGELSSAIVYYAEPYRIQVSGSENEACMTYLESDKHYTAQIIAFVAKMKSQPAVLHFVTPASMPYCYGTGVRTQDLDPGFLGSVQKPTEEPQTTTVQIGNSALLHSVNLVLFILSGVSYVICC